MHTHTHKHTQFTQAETYVYIHTLLRRNTSKYNDVRHFAHRYSCQHLVHMGVYTCKYILCTHPHTHMHVRTHTCVDANTNNTAGQFAHGYAFVQSLYKMYI